MNADRVLYCFVVIILVGCDSQRDPSLPVSRLSLQQIKRAGIGVPKGRSATLEDIIIKHFSINSSESTSYQLRDITGLLSLPDFDIQRPTVIYAHGYVELTEDDSVMTVVKAYRQNAGYNILILDWSNLAFGNYVLVALDLKPTSIKISTALLKLLKGGLSLRGLHFVGHSLGAHLMAAVARNLQSRGFVVPRLTGLDAAYPGFYPPLLSSPASPSDAAFVDMIHTDGGGYGAPQSSGHADFWPNGGTAKQPGCLPTTIFLTYEGSSDMWVASEYGIPNPRTSLQLEAYLISITLAYSKSTANASNIGLVNHFNENFCSHWRSWEFWSEAVAGEKYWARGCHSYDEFLRGQCAGEQVVMGPDTDSRLRGNFYLRTAAHKPFSLGIRGID